MKIPKNQMDEIKNYVVECLVADFLYDSKEALEAVEKSPFPKLLEKNPDYVLHYNFEYWAEYVDNNLKS